MNHQVGRKKLNRKSPHRDAMLRNQVISLIIHGHLQTTKARTKEVQKIAEKIVTLSRKGWDFNTIRRVKSMIPYNMDAINKIVKEIAPKYETRNGGYTRVIPLGKRPSDTAVIARLEWV